MERVSHAPRRPLGEPVVRLEAVSCEAAGGKKILDGIDLEVRRGECLMLVGRSGSGKTTITKCINGLIPSFEPGIEMTGSVSVCGLDPSRCEMYELAERVGSVFQNPKSQFFNLTSNDELAFGLESRGAPVSEIEARIRTTVEALDASDLIDRAILVEGGRIVREFSPEELLGLSSEEREGMGLRAVGAGDALDVHVPRAAMDNRTEAGLALDDYTVVRGDGAVFAPLSVTVPAGGVLGVLGENGTGKSTLLRGIAGLERKDAARVLVGGKQVARRARRRLISLVMQDVNNQLFSDSVWNECMLSLGGREEGEAKERAEATLASLDLLGARGVHPMALSGGQKQRLAVACALLSERRLILLDEPTSGLDLDRMKLVAKLVRDLSAKGATVVLVTHDREFLNRCCDSALELTRAG